MTAAIAGYRTAILALLADASKIIFTDNDVDQALRWALSEYSLHRPLIRTYDFDVLGTTAIHTMPADFVTHQITKVELWNSDPDSVTELSFYAYRPDEQWVINTRYQVGTGEILTVYYSAVHTVDSLDSASGTTVPAADETLLQVGAAGRAASMRAMNRVENIGMNPNEVQSYRQIAADYLSHFALLLSIDAGASVGLPDFPGDIPSKLVF